MAASVGHDDYALARVPEESRYSWLSVATQRTIELALRLLGVSAPDSM